MKTSTFVFSTIALFLSANNIKTATSGNTNFAVLTTGETPGIDTTAKKPNDTQFLVEAYNTGVFEVRASKLARRMADDKKVRKFAAMMRTNQEAMDKDLLALLIIKGYVPPRQASPEWKAKFKYLNEWMGKDFDRKYTAENISTQNDAIASFTRISINNKDADVKHFATGALAELQDAGG